MYFGFAFDELTFDKEKNMKPDNLKIIPDYLIHTNCFDTAAELPGDIKGEDDRNTAARKFCSVVTKFFTAFNELRIKNTVKRDARMYI